MAGLKYPYRDPRGVSLPLCILPCDIIYYLPHNSLKPSFLPNAMLTPEHISNATYIIEC